MDTLLNSSDGATAQLTPSVEDVLAQVDGSIDAERPEAAEQALVDGLSAHGGDPILLHRLATVERLRPGREGVALALFEAAHLAEPSKIEFICDYADELREQRRFAAAHALLTGPHADRQDPRVRAGLARLYSDLHLPALIVDALGGLRVLRRGQRWWRWRAWLVSGGPLWLVRRRRRQIDLAMVAELPAALPPSGPIPLAATLARIEELSAEDLIVGPAIERADELLGDDRLAEAAEVLADAAASASGNVGVLRQLADVERRLDHHWLALELLALACGLDGEDPATIGQTARTLVDWRRFRHAINLLSGLPAAARKDPAVRFALWYSYLHMNLPVLGFDAFGDRWPWQRDWWRSGGPLWFVRRRWRRRERSILAAWPADPATPSLPSSGSIDASELLDRIREQARADCQVAGVLERAERLIDADELDEAAGVLSEGITTLGPHVELLHRLASVEELRGRQQAALAHLEQSRTLDPSSLTTVLRYATALESGDGYRKAITFLTALPEHDRATPEVRFEMAWIYKVLGLPALAIAAYGDPYTLSAWQRKWRRRLWWRTGGPLRLLLWRPRRFEQRVLDAWPDTINHLRPLASITWPSGFDPTDIRSRLELLLFRASLVNERWWSIQWWAGRFAVVASSVLAWLFLWSVARQFAWPPPVPWAPIVATLSLLLALALLWSVFFRLTNSPVLYRMTARSAPVGLALAAGGYALIRLDPPPNGPLDLVAAVLIATAGMALTFFLAHAPTSLLGIRNVRRHWRRHPREEIVEQLLGILRDLDNPSARNDLDRRAAWMGQLERAAATLERRLSASLRPADSLTASWARERASGAATALRRLKRRIAAPADGSWDRLAASLRTEVAALATGDLGKLPWAEPPSPAITRRSRWRAAVTVLRTVAVAVTPLAALLAVQPVLGLDTGILQWAKVVSIGWAVLYLLLAADPTLREKIETAQSVSNLVSSSRKEPDRSEHREQ